MPDGSYEHGMEGAVPASRKHVEDAAAAYGAVMTGQEKLESVESDQAELGLDKEADFVLIREATEDQVLETGWYSIDQNTGQVTIFYTDKTFAESEAYAKIKEVEQALEQAGSDMQEVADDDARERVVETVQGAYDMAKIWSLEEQAKIAQYTKEVQADTDVAVTAEEEVTTVPEVLPFELELQQLEQHDLEVNRLIAELYRDYPGNEAVPRPDEVEVYIRQLWDIKEQIEAREKELDRLRGDEVAERDVRLLTPDLAQFTAATAKTLEQIEAARSAIGAVPEQPTEVTSDTEPLVLEASQRIDPDQPAESPEAMSLEERVAVRTQELNDLVFAKVDRMPQRTSVERAAVEQLFREYAVAPMDEKLQLADRIEQTVDLLGKTPPDPERVKQEAEKLLQDVESAHGENKDLIMTARSMSDLVREIIAERPQEINPVDQLIQEKDWQLRVLQTLAKMERFKTAHKDDLPADSEVLDEPVWATSRIPTVARRKDITPEVLDDDTDELPILVNTGRKSSNGTMPLQTDYQALYGDTLGQQVLSSVEKQRKWEAELYGPRFKPVFRSAEPTPAAEQSSATRDTAAAADESDLGELLRQAGQGGLEPNTPISRMSGTTTHPVRRPQKATTETRAASREKAREIRQISEKINQIENAGLGRFDRFMSWWTGEEISPVTLLAEKSFDEFELLVTIGKNDFSKYVAEKYPDLDLRYELFQVWEPYLKELKVFAARNPWVKNTTKAVIEGYVSTHLIDS